MLRPYDSRLPTPDSRHDIPPSPLNNQESRIKNPALPSLVILAAGRSTRFGAPKQLEPVGPGGGLLFDYAIHDAVRAGFGRVVLVASPGMEGRLGEHVTGRFPGLDLRVVTQEPPSGFGGRPKPWGTGHAVLAAASVLDGPFAVANADDYYGPAAFASLARHLEHPGGGEPRWALVGYRLSATLSPHGGVSRAVCEVDADFQVTGTTELLDVRETPEGLQGRTPAGDPVFPSGDEWVSMNLWGFTPGVVSLLDRRFEAFLAAQGDDPGAEFLLSTAVDGILAAGEATLRLLPSPDLWFGLTHAADRDEVRRRIAELVGRGLYGGL